jgi:hypothetical protein
VAAKKKATKRRKMSAEHKAALAEGRAQGRAVREYLAALESGHNGDRGSTREELEAKVADVQQRVDTEPDAAKRVEHIQKRLDLEHRLVDLGDPVDLDGLEAAFVEAVGPYSDRKSISYPAWREAGVPAATLKKAGLRQTR